MAFGSWCSGAYTANVLVLVGPLEQELRPPNVGQTLAKNLSKNGIFVLQQNHILTAVEKPGLKRSYSENFGIVV